MLKKGKNVEVPMNFNPKVVQKDAALLEWTCEALIRSHFPKILQEVVHDIVFKTRLCLNKTTRIDFPDFLIKKYVYGVQFEYNKLVKWCAEKERR